MAVRRDHAHHLGTKLPENAVENRSALFGGDRERRMRDELLQLARADPPALVEAHRGERGELVLRKAQDLEVRATTIERHTLLACRGDFHRRGRELARDLAQLL